MWCLCSKAQHVNVCARVHRVLILAVAVAHFISMTSNFIKHFDNREISGSYRWQITVLKPSNDCDLCSSKTNSALVHSDKNKILLRSHFVAWTTIISLGTGDFGNEIGKLCFLNITQTLEITLNAMVFKCTRILIT